MKKPSSKSSENPPQPEKTETGDPAEVASLGVSVERKRRPGVAQAETPALRVLPPASARDDVRRPTATTRKRVLVMDEHPMVEEWIGALIGGEADLVLAGHASDLAATAALVARGRPSLVLLEIARDVPRGLAIVSTLKAKFPKLRILVFSSCDEVANSVQVLRAGAHGFVSKAASGPELLRAIRDVLNDGVYLSSAMIGHLAAGVPNATPPPATGPAALLSQRELQVFAFIGEGLHPKEIAQRISLSVKTVESYLARIREKLNLRDARALFQDAVKWSKVRESSNGG